MGNYGKKKVDPHCIDMKAIRDMVGGTTPRPVAAKPSEENDTVSTAYEQVTSQKKESGKMVDHETKHLHGIQSVKRKSLHIDADLHHQLSSLMWVIGYGDITMEGLVNCLLTRHLKEYEDVLDAMTENI